MVEAKKLSRVFVHGEVRLQDPDPIMEPNKVREFYSDDYPELLNTSVIGPKIGEEEIIYTFSETSVGTKG